ncbi:MAG: right-handed parallel beta-helix repeat-containing protein, partial [Chthoniobacterales bacterium]
MTSRLILSLLACGAASLHAADYYVDAANTSAGGGTQASPWKEVSSAIASLQAGDTVHVAGGTYAPFEILGHSGDAGSPISIVVNSGATATINGVSGVNRDGIRIRDSSHIVIDGFTLVGTGDDTTSRAGISVQSSELGSRLGNDAVSGNHEDVVLRNNHISNYGKWGIFTAYVNGLVIENNSLSGSIDEHGLYISNASKDQVV